MTYHRICN